MTIASDLLQQHIQTLVDDNAQWQTLIADDMVWELAYAPALGHPARLSGREEVVGSRHVVPGSGGAFPLLRSSGCMPLPIPKAAVAEVKAEGLIKPTGRALSPRVCGVPACGRRQDRIPPRIFRSRAGSQGDGHANSWSRILRTRGNGPFPRVVTLLGRNVAGR